MDSVLAGKFERKSGERSEKRKGEGMSPESPAKRVTVVIPALQQGVASSNGVEFGVNLASLSLGSTFQVRFS